MNASVLDKALNVHLEGDPVSTTSRNARTSREVQSDVQQREAPRVRAIKRRQQRLEGHLKHG